MPWSYRYYAGQYVEFLLLLCMDGVSLRVCIIDFFTVILCTAINRLMNMVGRNKPDHKKIDQNELSDTTLFFTRLLFIYIIIVYFVTSR